MWTNVKINGCKTSVHGGVQFSFNLKRRRTEAVHIFEPTLPTHNNIDIPQRKGQEDREKGLQQRNSELQTRIKQLEEKITSLNSENESLVSNFFPFLCVRLSDFRICQSEFGVR